jgi:hypothetical protein
MYKLSLFSFLLGIITFWGCKEPDITPDNNKEFPIAIEVKENPEGGVEVTWPKVNINKFDNYTLIRSLDSLNFSPQFGDTLWVIDDIDQTKIIDKNLPLVGKMYYRFSANLKERSLQSKTVSYQRKDIFSFDNIVYDTKFYNPIKGLIYLVNSNNRTIRTINIETGAISKEVNIISIGTKVLTFRNEDPDNIYSIGEDQIEIYDATTLALRQTLKNPNYPTDRFVSITSGYGKYYVTMYGYPLKIKVFDAATKALLKTHSTGFNIDSRMVIRIFPNQKRLLSYYENGGQDDEAILIDLDDNGNIMSSNKVVDISYPFNSYNCAIAPDGESVIFNKKNIMDKDLKSLAILNSVASNPGTLPYYSPNSAYLISDDGFSSSFIINMKDYQILKTIPFKSSSSSFVSSSPIFLTNKEYVSFGEQFISSFSRRIVISKTKFL